MGLRLKDDVDPEILENYGFKTADIWSVDKERFFEQEKYSVGDSLYHRIAMNLDDVGIYRDEECDITIPSVRIRNQAPAKELSLECSPDYYYYFSGDKLDAVMDIIFDMIQDGILEKY